GFCG
ncbi:hypothetical protein VCNHCC010F_000599B, partial [Vibrio cholerae O1 str. NHCC-010F]